MTMRIFFVVVFLGIVTGSYINNDVCKTEYNTVCEDVEKPHIEHKTERIRDTVYNQQCRTEQKPVTTTEYKNECRTEYDEVCSSNPRTECNAVQRSVPHTAYERSV